MDGVHSMDYFLNRYVERCRLEFSQEGFKRRGNTFVRVTAGVAQGFTLKRYRLGLENTIELRVIPLHYRIAGVQKASCELDECEAARWDHTVWRYQRNCSESMETCIEELIGAIKTHMIPIFNGVDRSNKTSGGRVKPDNRILREAFGEIVREAVLPAPETETDRDRFGFPGKNTEYGLVFYSGI